LSCVVADVADWLAELGYDFNSLVPPVSYSGLVGRRHDDDDDDVSSCGVAVTSAFRCAYDGSTARFSHLSTVSSSLVTSAQGLRGAGRGGGVASAAYLFGRGVLLTASGDGDTVTVTVLDSASQSLATLATTLLNGSTVVGPRLVTSHGRDVLHVVRRDDVVDDVIDDVRRVVEAERGVGGLNVTIHRVHDLPSSSSVRHVDVRLHGRHATLNVRCGGTVASQRSRLRQRALQRAVDAAWTAERQLVRTGRLTATSWTGTQAEQLLSVGRVDGFTGEYLRDDRLVECPRNIRFVPVT